MTETLWLEVRTVNMSRKILNLVVIAVAVFVMSGCSALQESLSSQMEVPTLENQANRVAIGMTIVRENNIMAYKMPISADASWPQLVASDINDTTKSFIDNALMNDPYYATQHYTKHIQRRMLGSAQSLNSLGQYANLTATILDQSVSPLAYRAFYKILIFYGYDKQNWPDIFNYNSSLNSFLDFRDGNFQDIDSPTGDVYESVGEALISLAPVNLQKDLTSARLEMLDAFNDVADYKSQIGVIETKLKDKKNNSQHYELQQELNILETKSKEAESVANEKEAIYFELLDQAVVAVQSDIDLSDENYVKLAKNINIVAKEVYTGSTEAYTSFTLALGNIASNNIMENLPRELESLAVAKAYVPLNLQSKYNQRVARIVKNSVYLLPNVFIGTYYASKQLALANKYENFTNIILTAYQTKEEQEKAQAKAQAEVEQDKNKEE